MKKYRGKLNIYTVAALGEAPCKALGKLTNVPLSASQREAAEERVGKLEKYQSLINRGKPEPVGYYLVNLMPTLSEREQ